MDDLGIFIALAFALTIIVAHKLVERRVRHQESVFWRRMSEVRSLRKTGMLPAAVEFGPNHVRRSRHTDPFIRPVR